MDSTEWTESFGSSSDDLPEEDALALPDEGGTPEFTDEPPPPAPTRRGRPPSARKAPTARGRKASAPRAAKRARAGGRGTRGRGESRPVPTLTGTFPDLAGHLAGLLDIVRAEVEAVGELSRRIDDQVRILNELRSEQAGRLHTLDALRDSATNATLGAFLDETIQPQLPEVEEVIPDRLLQ